MGLHQELFAFQGDDHFLVPPQPDLRADLKAAREPTSTQMTLEDPR